MAHAVAQGSIKSKIKKASALPVEAFEEIANSDQVVLINATRVGHSCKTDALSSDLGNSSFHSLTVGFVDQPHSNSFVKCR